MASAVAVETTPHSQMSVGAVLDFLEEVDLLPEDACGVFTVGPDSRRPGVVFVSNRRVCWAAAPGLGRRLTALIRERAPRAIEAEELERLFQQCRESGTPLGETLVDRGFISAEGFREALRRHTAESLLKLLSGKVTPRWIQRDEPRYDLRFSFTTAEILTTLSAATQDMLDYRLDERVPWIHKHEGGLVAFRRTDLGVLPIAMHAVPSWSAADIWEIGRWATGYHDMVTAVDTEAWLSCASGRDQTTFVILRAGTLYYLLTCERREHMSRILHELISDRARSRSL